MPNEKVLLFGVGAAATLALVGYLVLRRYGPVAAAAINPLNHDNIFATGADAVVEAVTGDQAQTVGGLLHDLFTPRAGMAANEYSPAPGIIVTQSTGTAKPPPIGSAAPYVPSFDEMQAEFLSP